MTTYDFYKNEYYGEVIAEDNFPKWLSRATDELIFITNNQITDEALAEYSTQIQKAVCALMDALFLIDKVQSDALNTSNHGTIKSISSGSESISYGDTSNTEIYTAVKSTQNKEKYLFELVRKYLHGTGLLYQGV